MPIETWFPTAIFFDDVAVPETAHDLALAVVREERERSARGRTDSTDTANDLHLDPRLDPLIVALLPSVRAFVFDALQIDPERTQVFLGRCWALVPGAGEWHVHGGAVVSGIFHLEAPPGSGGIEFRRAIPAAFDHLQLKKRTELTFDRTVYPAVRHRLMLFGSDVPHRALAGEPEASGAQVGIAFDLYAMTDIGIPRGGMPPVRELKRIG